jgi:hypothetical protein
MSHSKFMAAIISDDFDDFDMIEYVKLKREEREERKKEINFFSKYKILASLAHIDLTWNTWKALIR